MVPKIAVKGNTLVTTNSVIAGSIATRAIITNGPTGFVYAISRCVRHGLGCGIGDGRVSSGRGEGFLLSLSSSGFLGGWRRCGCWWFS